MHGAVSIVVALLVVYPRVEIADAESPGQANEVTIESKVQPVLMPQLAHVHVEVKYRPDNILGADEGSPFFDAWVVPLRAGFRPFLYLGVRLNRSIVFFVVVPFAGALLTHVVA